MKPCPISLFAVTLLLVPTSSVAEESQLPEKLRSVLTKLDTFETEQIAATEKAIEKKRAEVASYLRTEMEKYARDGKVDTAVAIRAAILEIESASPLEKVRKGDSGKVPAATGRAQSVFRENDFEEIAKSMSGNTFFTPSVKRGVLELTVKNAGPNYEAFGFSIPLTDFSERPVLRVKARAEKPVVIRIDLQDARGNGTSAVPVHERIPRSAEFRDFHFDFSGYAEKDSAVDLTQIQTIVIYANPGADAFSGVIHFDKLESADQKN
jgi:hypothetical protein